MSSPEDYEAEKTDDIEPEDRNFIFLWTPPGTLTRARHRCYCISAYSESDARTLAQVSLRDAGLYDGELRLWGEEEDGDMDAGMVASIHDAELEHWTVNS